MQGAIYEENNFLNCSYLSSSLSLLTLKINLISWVTLTQILTNLLYNLSLWFPGRITQLWRGWFLWSHQSFYIYLLIQPIIYPSTVLLCSICLSVCLSTCTFANLRVRDNGSVISVLRLKAKFLIAAAVVNCNFVSLSVCSKFILLGHSQTHILT